MDRGFQSLLLTGKYVAGDCNFTPITTYDDPHITIKTNSHTQTYNQPLLSSLNYPYSSSFNTFNENIQTSNEYTRWSSVETDENNKRLKTQPSTASFNFFNPPLMFTQLPELRSIEQVNEQEMRLKQKVTPVAETVYRLETTSFSNYFTPAPPQPLQPPFSPLARLSSTEVAYRRRQTLSDKTRSLQKLLPVEKKMDMATIYEEAYKYITFLKAQISVLESMPVLCCSSSLNLRSGNPRYGGLGKLNRQQLLQVLVNSPATQSVLYSNGCCVYSLEQLMLFNDVVQKRFFVSDH